MYCHLLLLRKCKYVTLHSASSESVNSNVENEHNKIRHYGNLHDVLESSVLNEVEWFKSLTKVEITTLD